MNARLLVRLAAIPSLLLLAGACASRQPAALVAQPLSSARSWVSTIGRSHPLAGRIWEVRGQRFVDEAALDDALAAARLVLLGETHDNPDHHLLQARLLAALVGAGRRPAVAFEMLDVPQQPDIDAAQARAPRDPDAIAEAVDWAHGGWPAFSLYRPIFEVAARAGLRVVAASLPRHEVAEVVERGPSALPPELRERLERAGPLPDDVARAMREEMRDSHCGELPEEMLDPMVLGQRARDAELAGRLASADRGQGAVLVAGTGHVRTDRGVPTYLASDAPGRAVLAIAFLEVSPRRLAAEAYASEFGSGGTLPLDYAVFTPGAERPDPCAAFKRRVKPKPLPPMRTAERR